MNIEQVLTLLPPGSVFRSILPGLLTANDVVWRDAYERLRKLDQVSIGENPLTPTWKYSEAEALAIFRAAVSLPFPPVKHYWEDSVHDLLFLLLRSPHQSLVAPAAEAYPTFSDRSKCAVLALFGACGSMEAAKALIPCIRVHGWPNSIYERVFTEMAKLLPYASVLFPDLLTECADRDIGSVTNIFVAAIGQGHLDYANEGAWLSPIAERVSARLPEILAAAEQHQSREGIAWRFAEEYWSVRQQAEAWLDIAGYLKDSTPVALLEKALQLNDPRVAAFAVSSVLRSGGYVEQEVLNPIAACHETRALLFQLLHDLGKGELFPPTYRTWDAFAAANMVDWLMYPTELGREPEYLEKMAVFTSSTPEGEVLLYVWRFRNEEEPWYAGVSGPYLRKGEPCPLHGDSTFSCFEKWEEATAEQHAKETLNTLNEWRIAWQR